MCRLVCRLSAGFLVSTRPCDVLACATSDQTSYFCTQRHPRFFHWFLWESLSVGYRLRTQDGQYLNYYRLSKAIVLFFRYFSVFPEIALPLVCFGISRYSRLTNIGTSTGIVSVLIRYNVYSGSMYRSLDLIPSMYGATFYRVEEYTQHTYTAVCIEYCL